jgi:hypothetical protein
MIYYIIIVKPLFSTVSFSPEAYYLIEKTLKSIYLNYLILKKLNKYFYLNINSF